MLALVTRRTLSAVDTKQGSRCRFDLCVYRRVLGAEIAPRTDYRPELGGQLSPAEVATGELFLVAKTPQPSQQGLLTAREAKGGLIEKSCGYLGDFDFSMRRYRRDYERG